MNLKKIRDLDIAKSKFNFANELIEGVDYLRWVDYVNRNDNHFKWYENTKEGKEILGRLGEIPDDFKDSYLSILNKVRCFLNYNVEEKTYTSSVGFSPESKKVSISFEKSPSISELNIYLNMAKHLDALLLRNGTEIIDESCLESLS